MAAVVTFILQILLSTYFIPVPLLEPGGAMVSKSSRQRKEIATKEGYFWGFPGGAVVENLPANAGDTGSSLGLGRSHMPRSN